jgi:hypothetical protein
MKEDSKLIQPFYMTKIFVAYLIDTIIKDFKFFAPSIILQHQDPF